MADQKINALPTKTTPTSGDKCLMSGAAEEYLIDYDKLATAILNKLTSKTFTLDQGTKTLIAAINELNSKTNVFATSKQRFWDLNSTLKQGICYPIYLNDTAISELTNKKYNVTGKGIFFAGASPDVMLMLGSGNTILTGRFYSDQDPVLYITKGEKVS